LTPGGGEIERNVDEHVFLTTDHAAASGLLEQGASVDIVSGCGDFGRTARSRRD
jgi:hypothetical protein